MKHFTVEQRQALKRAVEREKHHEIRRDCRAKVHAARTRGVLSSERAKGVNAHYMAAFTGVAVKPHEWGDLLKQSSARITLVE